MVPRSSPAPSARAIKQGRVKRAARKAHGRFRQSGVGDAIPGKDMEMSNRVAPDRHAQRIECPQRFPAEKPAAQGVAGFGCAVEQQRLCAAQRKRDGGSGPRRPRADNQRIFSTHSRKGKTRRTRALETPACASKGGHSAGR